MLESCCGIWACVKQPGDDLSQDEVDSILDYYLGLLEAAATGNAQGLSAEVDRMHVQVPLVMPEGDDGALPTAFTLSGGVGELVYRHLRGEPWPSSTEFGDLGVDLAQRLTHGPFWADHWRRHRPEAGGRATVFGLLRHSTHVSGSTLFLPHPEDLPLRDVPILGSLSDDSLEGHVTELIQLARGSPRGACIRLNLKNPDNASIKSFAQRLTQVLTSQRFPAAQPLVLFVAQNLGKVLGQYITAWGSLPIHVIVIDEITCENAQYAHIGTAH